MWIFMCWKLLLFSVFFFQWVLMFFVLFNSCSRQHIIHNQSIDWSCRSVLVLCRFPVFRSINRSLSCHHYYQQRQQRYKQRQQQQQIIILLCNNHLMVVNNNDDYYYSMKKIKPKNVLVRKKNHHHHNQHYLSLSLLLFEDINNSFCHQK